ncbi:MAG: hypothetical protein LBF97_01710 [Elusimicrobiota bacterium]|jgi:hypothetical protein|nr:hypothetical protein [Elusimicrobiota bacterium]
MNDLEKEFLEDTVTQKIKSTRKKGINSKRKGKTFEDVIAKKFSDRFKLPFKRNFGSGMILGGKNFKNQESFTEEQKLMLVSDIMTPKIFKYSIECKSYNDISFHSFFSDKSILNDFLNQCCSDAIKLNKDPMLIIHLNNKPTLVMIPEKESIERLYLTIKYKGFNMLLLDDLLQMPNEYFLS